MRRKIGGWIFILVVVSVCALGIGRYTLQIKDIIKILSGQAASQADYNVFYYMRLPRVLLVILSGAGLSLAGAIYQMLFHNPLVSPDILGVSSGCSLGAAIAIVFFTRTSTVLQGASFLFGILTVSFVIAISKFMPRDRLLGLLLAGIVASALASSLLMILKYISDPYKDLPTIEFWLMGGFYLADWQQVKIVGMIIAFAGTLLLALGWQLQVMELGDENAFALGVKVEKVRIISIIAATLLVAVIVSIAGVVSWIGLIAPHIARLSSKQKGRGYLIAAMLIGSILLLVADTAARTLFASEVPISIFTSLLGAPFLGYLLYRRGKEDELNY